MPMNYGSLPSSYTDHYLNLEFSKSLQQNTNAQNVSVYFYFSTVYN